MISAVGESARVALQAATTGPSPQAAENNKQVEKPANAVGEVGKGKGDSVTISTEAKLLTSAALNSPEASQENYRDKSEKASTDQNDPRQK